MYDPTTGLQLRLMGVPEVSLDGVPLTFSRRRALALLVYLAVTGHVYSRDVLATLLSGETSETQARKRLSNALAELRQRVGDYIVTTRDTAAFNVDLPWSTDVRAFRTALANGQQQEGIEQLQHATDLFHEEFLSGLLVSEASGFDEWVMLQGEALRTQAVQALQTIVARAIRLHANADGIAAARRLVSLEPWLEEAHRQLMLLLTRVGQRQEALAQYEVCRSILLDELGEAPSPETVALYNRIHAPHVAVPSALPLPPSPLVGRETELQLLTSRLSDSECRLVTLIGLGGSGKTRLALECARVIADSASPAEQQFPDGVFFLALDACLRASPTDEVEDVTRHIAQAIDAAVGHRSPGSADAAGTLRATLASRSLLLVLDGAHQVPAAALAVTIDLLASCPGVTVLVTAREPLRCPDEHLLVVGGLALPSGPQDVERAPASRVLLMEAQRARLGFTVRDEDRAHVVQLCGMVGGLPLALTRLAPWLPKLEPAAIVAELEVSLELLTATDPRMGESHPHHSMQMLVAHTWARLSADDTTVLRRLSVFWGGFDSAAARAVAGCTMAHISRLMDVGILEQGKDGRYQVHPLLRSQGSHELAARPREADETRRRHVEYFTGLVESLVTHGGRGPAATQTLSRDLDNLRGAWQSAIEQRTWWLLDRMCVGVVSSFSISGLALEGAAILGSAAGALRSALQADKSNAEVQTLLGRVLLGQGALLLRAAQYDRADHALRRAAEIGQETASGHLQAHVEYQRGMLCAVQAAYADATDHTHRALCLAQTAELPSLVADCRLASSRLAYVQGHAATALEQVHELIADHRAAGDTRSETMGLIQLAAMAIDQGKCEQGRLALDRARHLVPETGSEPLIESAFLSASGLYHTAIGCYTQAEQDQTRALHINRAIGWRDAVAILPILGETGSLISLGRLARIQGDMTTAWRYLSEALEVSREVGSRLAEALALTELSLLDHTEGRNDRACQRADQALGILERSERRALRRFALLALGHAEFDLGHLTEAAAAYAQALVADREGGNRWRVIESTVDLARVALAKEDLVRASALLAPVLHDVLEGDPSTIDEPARAYLTAYQILHSIGDPREGALLESGHRLVQERTEGLPDEMRGLLFLQRVSPSRDLLHAGNGDGVQRDLVSVISG